MAVLIIMNIESTMTRHDVIPILESRIRVGRCSATSRNMSSMARTQHPNFLEKLCCGNILYVSSITLNERYVNITYKRNLETQ